MGRPKLTDGQQHKASRKKRRKRNTVLHTTKTTGGGASERSGDNDGASKQFALRDETTHWTTTREAGRLPFAAAVVNPENISGSSPEPPDGIPVVLLSEGRPRSCFSCAAAFGRPLREVRETMMPPWCCGEECHESSEIQTHGAAAVSPFEHVTDSVLYIRIDEEEEEEEEGGAQSESLLRRRLNRLRRLQETARMVCAVNHYFNSNDEVSSGDEGGGVAALGTVAAAAAAVTAIDDNNNNDNEGDGISFRYYAFHTQMRTLDDILTELLEGEDVKGPPPLSREEISSLPVVRLTNIVEGTGGGGNEWCTICLQMFEATEYLKRLPCKHYFHEKCLTPWLLKVGNCPNCRVTVAI